MSHEEASEKMIEDGGEYSAEIGDMALPSGQGVARLGGLVVFVPGTVPGDRVRLKVVRLERRFAYGELLRMEEESPLRERPQCPHVGRCGGCGLQALSYEGQLKVKENHLRQVLKRIGGEDLEGVEVSTIVPSVDRFFYRGKIEFSFGYAGPPASASRVIVGLRGHASPLHPEANRVVPVDGCPLFSPAASVALPPVRELIDGSGLAPYDPATGKGTLKRLVLREAKGTGELMVHLIAASDISRHLAGLRERLPRALPRLRSIYATEGAGPRLLWGKPAIDELLSGLLLRVYPLSFLQPNPRTAERLYERIKAVAGITGGERVLGLYCGAGSIELFLGRYVKEVVGIDSSGESIACARENAVLNKSGNCLFLEEKAERAARRLRPGKVDLLVVDPPRKGMTGQTLAAVNEIRPERMIYVSCNPSTLARDLKELRRTYRAGTIIPFDFFPHTAHFEVLTLLERTGPAR